MARRRQSRSGPWYQPQTPSPNKLQAGYLPSTYYFSSDITDWPVVPLNFDTTDPADACEPYANGTRSLKGVIPLVRRGTCTFATKQANLVALGAEYILFYNNEGPLITPYTDDENGLIALITAEAGAAIIDTVKAGGNVTADFSINPEQVVGLDYPAGGRPNTFTSWGGTYDLQIKPDIAAPGGQVRKLGCHTYWLLCDPDKYADLQHLP